MLPDKERKPHLHLNGLLIAGAVAAALLAAAAASAAEKRLLNIRSAVRGDRLRIVFDLSAEVSYRLLVRPQAGEGGELTLAFSGLAAAGLPERVELAGPGRLALRIERGEGAALLVRLALPDRAVEYRHFPLGNPPRVVLDLTLGRPGPRKAVDFRTGPIILAPTRPVGSSVLPGPPVLPAPRAPAGRRVLLARTPTVVLSPPLEEEWLAPIDRGSDRPGGGAPGQRAPGARPRDGVRTARVWRPLFERPPIPEPKAGEAGAAAFLAALKFYRDRKLPQAAEGFEVFVRKHPKSRLAPAAAFLAGDSYFEVKPAPRNDPVTPGEEKKDSPKGEKAAPEKKEKKPPPRQKWVRLAGETYRRALERFPRTDWAPWGLLQLGRSQSELGLYFRAENTFQELLDRYPNHPLTAVALAHQGFTNLKLGDAELALEIFGEVLKHPKASPRTRALARYGLGGANFMLKKVDAARAEFEKAQKAAPMLAKYSPDILFLMGETFMASRQYAQARKSYLAQIELFPRSENLPLVLTRVAESHFLEGQFDQAVTRYAEVIERFPDTESSTVSLIRLADLALEKPEFAHANRKRNPTALRDPLGTYRRIGKRGTPRALAELAWLRLGEELLRRKEYGEAVDVFQTMADQYGDGRLYGRALFGLEEALVGQIDRTYREKRYVEVLRLFHSEQQRGLKGLIQPAPLVQIADSYQQLGLFEKADEVLGRVDVAEATPAERESLHILKIQGLMAQERWKVLEPELKGYLRKYPKGRIRLKALRSLAEVLIREERWAEAEGFLNKASREAGTGVERARMEHLLARVFTHGERYAMAVDSLRRAIRMTPAGEAAPPFLADAYYLLGENLMALGQFSEAASVLKKVASRFPKDGLRGWALFEAGAAQRRIGELQGASKTLEAVSTGPASGFWRRMAQAMKEDIEWWQKHDRLQN